MNEKCYKRSTDGSDFKLKLVRVYWSSDLVEACSVCNTVIYEPDYQKYHKVKKKDDK